MSRKWKEMKGEEGEEELELVWFWEGEEGWKWVMFVRSQGVFSIRIGQGVDEGVLLLLLMVVEGEAWVMVAGLVMVGGVVAL